ncbi:MAG: hypothetical protein DRP47_04480 [Candidatus Zixiibacteriota bacterium]|nr:MAG: hypothetical protein DRP47_04480 [candidate division Zixibacteria bacterium]
MKGSRLIIATMLLLMIFACFISVPVFAEGPWDVDSNNDGNGIADSSGESNGGEIIVDGTGESGLDEIIIRIILKVIIDVITHSGVVSAQS